MRRTLSPAAATLDDLRLARTENRPPAHLRDAGVRVLHDQPLPFPLGNWRAEFVAGLRQALT
jgi:hypothetical protein